MNGDGPNVAIACQGGGSHTAFTAGVLQEVLPAIDASPADLVGISGTSGGAFAAVGGWYGLQSPGASAPDLLRDLWRDIAAVDPIDGSVNAAVVGTKRLEEWSVPVPEATPYLALGDEWGRAILRSALERHIDFERIPALSTDSAPTVCIGAIDIIDGRFRTFVDGEITAKAVLASAAVPELFEPVEIDESYYWDGLLSQNPPIRPHFEGPVTGKPDELWVVQINPETRERVPQSLRSIIDRRNELAGNLSLEHELRFVHHINELVEAGRLGDEYKHTEVEHIRFEQDRSYASKLDRRPSLIADLLRDGRAAGRSFLDDRVSYTSTSTS